MTDSTHGRVRRVHDDIGITLAGTEHVMSDEDAAKLAARIYGLAGGQSAVAAAKAQIVGWLRDMAHDKHSGFNWAADAIEAGAPERWAAEREGERG